MGISQFFFLSVIIYHISLDINGDLSLTGACVLRRVAGWVGIGVAGMIKMIVSQWIIPENSLRKTHQ